MGLKFKEICCLMFSVGLFVSGLFMVCFSVIWLFRLIYHFEIAPNVSISPLIILTILGVIHLFVTWLGVKGPQREHDFHIIGFLACIILLCIIELTIGIWSMVIWDEADAAVETLIIQSFEEFKKNNFSDENTWVKLQSDLKCCGLQGLKSYPDPLPHISCCDNSDDEETTVAPTPGCSKYFTQSCQTPARRYVKKLMLNSALMSFLITLFLVCGITLYIIYYKELREVRKKRIARRLEIERAQERVIRGGDSAAPPLAVPPKSTKPPDTSTNTHVTTTTTSTSKPNKNHAPTVPLPSPPPPGLIHEKEVKENPPPPGLTYDRVPAPTPRATSPEITPT